MSLTLLIEIHEPGWERIADGVAHPRGAGGAVNEGVLIRHTQTGRYVLATYGGWRSVPHAWASAIHAGVRHADR